MTVLWQNRHCQGQPRMISMAIRSCAVSTNGTIGAVGKGHAVEVVDHAGLIAAGTSSRSPARSSAMVPSSRVLGS